MELLGWDQIAELDLEWVKNKLMHRKAGTGWSRDRVEATALEYRRFLYLMKIFPNELVAPTLDVDRFWHQHILDTMKYAHDCQAIFGYFLHHYPYLGLNGEQDDALRHQAIARMRELYEQTFHTDSSRGPEPDETPGTCAGTMKCEHDIEAAFCAASAVAVLAKVGSAAASARMIHGEISVGRGDTARVEPAGSLNRFALLH
jgi:hypothetical protein